MHTLRWVIGDDAFFPALKGFATDARFTYNNMVTTNDVEQYFSKASGKDLKPLFNLYLRTTNRLEISIKQTEENKYQIKLLNLDMQLPVNITIDGVTKIVQLSAKETTISASGLPLIDTDGYYFKRIIVE
jgi:aminopeptidase N